MKMPTLKKSNKRIQRSIQIHQRMNQQINKQAGTHVKQVPKLAHRGSDRGLQI